MSNQTNACPLPADNPFVLDIQDFYGYNLIGSFFSSAIWGISCLQLFIYYLHSESDSAFLKTLLASLWVLDTANEILILKSNWPVLILQYGRIANLAKIQPELINHIWVEFIVSLVVQLYFIHRIYKFSLAVLRGMKSKLLLGAIALLTFLAVAQTVCMIVYVVFSYGKPIAVIGNKRQIAINLTIRGLSVVVDVSIAIAMVYLLRGKGHFSSSRRMISRLMIVIVSSGSLTAALSVIILVLVVLHPKTLHFVMFDYPFGSIYFSTLLANLNSRSFVRGPEDVNIASQNIGSSNHTIVLQQLSNSQGRIPQSYIKGGNNRLDQMGTMSAHLKGENMM
ncbi:hypothetical protein E4T56_gene16590 [Termitomyces sp. T112]|nr:hypothetical protein E4T56_gene16590 [Termitomyces sp. T112]